MFKTTPFVCKMTLITVLLFCSLILVNIASETSKAFNKFANIYDIKYRNLEEKKKSFKNFQNNYKKVAKLNQDRINDFKSTGVHSYHLNRYADQDVSEILERYGVTMLPCK